MSKPNQLKILETDQHQYCCVECGQWFWSPRATAQTATRARQTASAMGVQTGYWSRLTRGGRVPNGTVERSEEGRQVRRELRHAEQDAGELREQMTSASGHRTGQPVASPL